ncbi:MAG: hypothetical protein IJV03_02175 [Alphaproteobacteria bacterium]|nr:hypothetical protein [Alphaproteobacteria bacterium]
MIQPLYTDKQRQELRQHQILMHGGRTQKNQLSQETIKQIKKDYYDMFIGFTSVNWSKPGTKLGTAWQKALNQMATYIKTKSNVQNNPVYECLVDIHKKFSKRISEHIMKCRGRESETVLPESLHKQFAQDEKMITKGKSALDSVFTQYMPKQQTQEKPKMASQDIRKILLQEYLARQRVA